jgi:hypothetical protein
MRGDRSVGGIRDPSIRGDPNERAYKYRTELPTANGYLEADGGKLQPKPFWECEASQKPCNEVEGIRRGTGEEREMGCGGREDTRNASIQWQLQQCDVRLLARHQPPTPPALSLRLPDVQSSR